MTEVRDIPKTALISIVGHDLVAIMAGGRGEVYGVIEGAEFHAWLVAHGSSADEATATVEKHRQQYFIRAVTPANALKDCPNP